MGGGADKEFVIIDESGDPGPAGNPIYILIALHAGEEALHSIRSHLTAFRYHEGATKEFKDSRWAAKPMAPGGALDRLVRHLIELVTAEQVTISGNWLRKETYRSNGGPYLSGAKDDPTKFRHYQLRRILERHVGRRPWGSAAELVIDRWAMSEDQRADLEQYLLGNYRLRPVPWITLVDSVYCDFVQVVDILSKVVRRCIEGNADEYEEEVARALVDLAEIERGYY